MDITEVQHDSITDDNRADLSAHMEKFDSFEAAAVDGMALKKLTGVPYKFPESMDKLPDDASRAEFTSKAHGLLGTTPGISSIDDLKDVDMAIGMKEGGKADENIGTMLKNLAVEKKWPASVVQDIAGLYNGPLTEYGIRTLAAKQDADKIAQKTATNEALIAHPSIGSEQKLNDQSELVRRTFQNKAGLTAAEYETVGDALAESVLTQNDVLSRALINLLAPMSKTASNESGDGTPPAAPVVSEADKQVMKDIYG